MSQIKLAVTALQAREYVARKAALEHYCAALLHGVGLMHGDVLGLDVTPDGPVLVVERVQPTPMPSPEPA